MAAYYNEFDPYAAQWLRNLIKAGHIAPGEVDERDIRDIKPLDLIGFDQCHFFAGLGGWSYALRLAGWPDDRPVWTGSCPCQPFSAAGKGEGFADKRHLWPAWFHLIEQCEPGIIFGEQVEAAIKHGWLDLVQTDLEGKGYAFGAVGIPAAGVGAPHVRQRLWFVAESNRQFSGQGRAVNGGRYPRSDAEPRAGFSGGINAGKLADAAPQRCGETRSGGGRPEEWTGDGCESSGMGNANDTGPQGRSIHPERPGELAAGSAGLAGFWRETDWLPCRGGKARPVEPGTFPLAHGVPARVGRLRAYGNAIVPQVAAEVVRAYIECQP